MARSALPRAWEGARVAVLSPTPTHPQDFGNRKRIFRVCSRYAEEGALVTFIHYPAELEWRAQIPRRAERVISRAWSQYFTIAPTRPLHEDPRGRYHTIDEWWDPAIGEFLMWLFSVESYDIFIVNYSWLSKALQFAPRSTFKILDTHDKFSGRREMLESLGLHPEFFYTTEAEERVALDRADLVWAIKREEAAQLARMTLSPVLALPHLDPFAPIARPAPDADGYLRVGVIGARNNVNRMNITGFLEAAEPIFAGAFAPVKVVVAGSVCSLLENVRSPFVELAGRVENVEDFYASVDCVAVPMRSSTGLKIKTGEALSLGMPVISLAHAFEGYEAADPLHRLNDFADMAHALVDLSFAPHARLDMLADASRRAHERTAAVVADAYARSDKLVRERRQQIVVAVDSRALVAGSVFNLVLNSIYEELAAFAAVVIAVVKGSARDVAGNPDSVDRFRRVVVASDLADVELLQSETTTLGAGVVDLAGFLKRVRPAMLVADALHPALLGGLADTVAVARSEMIALSEGSAAFPLPARGYGAAFVATPRLSSALAAAMATAGADHVPSPCFWRHAAAKFVPARDMSGIRKVALLGDAGSGAVRVAAAMARAWDLEPIVVTGIGAEQSSKPVSMPADGFLAAMVDGRLPPPAFAVDLSAGQPGLPLAREMLDRLHIPVATAWAAALPGFLHIADEPLTVRSENGLWRAFRFLALGGEAEHVDALKSDWRDLESERSWAWIARYCAKVLENNDAQFA